MAKAYPMIMIATSLLLPSISAAPSDPNECSTKSNFITSWFIPDSLDLSTDVWEDISGNGNHGYIGNDLSGIGVFSDSDPTNELYLNNQPVVYGSTTTQIYFQPSVTAAHTVFNLCKYLESGTKGRIIQGEALASFFGHWNKKSGVAFAGGWITVGSPVDNFGNDWVLSSQTMNLYRGNGVDFTENSGTGGDIGRLEINDGLAPTQLSDFACAEVIIVNNQELDLTEIECIEQYFSAKYDLGIYVDTEITPTTPTPTTSAPTTSVPTTSAPTTTTTAAANSCDSLDIDGFLGHCSTLWNGRADEIDTISANIDANSVNIGLNSNDIGANTANIGVNTANIDTITANLGTNTDSVDTNTANIATNSNNIGTNSDNIATNIGNIATLTAILDEVQLELTDLSNPVFPAKQDGVGVLDDFADKLNNNAVLISLVSLMTNIILLTFGCYFALKLNKTAQYQKVRNFVDSDTEHQFLK